MAHRTSNIEKSSTMWPLLSHTPILLPPSNAALYAAAVAAATSAVAGFSFTMAQRAWGGASSIDIVATTATGFTSGMTLVFQVVGRDENHEPISEFITFTGNAAATQRSTSVGLYSSVDSVTTFAITAGTPSGSGALFGVGVATATAGDTAKIPNPYRGVPATSLACWSMFTAFGSATLSATSVAPHTALTVVLGTTNQVRVASVGIFGQDPRSFLEA